LQADVDGAGVAVDPTDRDGHGDRLAPGDVGVLGPQGDGEIGPGLADHKVVGERLAAQAADVLDADEVVAVGGRVEDQERVFTEAGAAVVVAVVDGDGGHAAG